MKWDVAEMGVKRTDHAHRIRHIEEGMADFTKNRRLYLENPDKFVRLF